MLPHLTKLGKLFAHPLMYLVVLVFAALWYVFDRETFDWRAIATLATWFMTLLITRTAARDTQAIHAKLDELLRSDPDAETELAKLDSQELEHIARFRDEKHRRLAE